MKKEKEKIVEEKGVVKGIEVVIVGEEKESKVYVE